ncbi:MAG: hypothetical protein ABI675_17725 [Chitinophagaceae bacterium]
MLTFTRKFIGNVLVAETGNVLTNCKFYEVLDNEVRIGRFYSGDNYSFAEFQEQKIRIESKRHFFSRSEHKIFNQYTKALIGYYEIPNGRFMGDNKAKLHLANGYTYRWKELYDHRKVLKPGTWGLYRFDLGSEKHFISYYGRMSPNHFRNINPEQVFEGEVQSTEGTFLLPVFSGIFIMEEKFRQLEQQPD